MYMTGGAVDVYTAFCDELERNDKMRQLAAEPFCYPGKPAAGTPVKEFKTEELTDGIKESESGRNKDADDGARSDVEPKDETENP